MILYYILLEGNIALWHYSALELSRYEMLWPAMAIHETTYFSVFATDCYSLLRPKSEFADVRHASTQQARFVLSVKAHIEPLASITVVSPKPLAPGVTMSYLFSEIPIVVIRYY